MTCIEAKVTGEKEEEKTLPFNVNSGLCLCQASLKLQHKLLHEPKSFEAQAAAAAADLFEPAAAVVVAADVIRPTIAAADENTGSGCLTGALP